MARPIGNALLALCLVSIAACAGAPWQARPAPKPLVATELAVYPLSIAGPVELQGEDLGPAASALHDGLAALFAAQGFRVVLHPPYSGDLELSLHVARAPGAGGPDGARVLLDLRSDGFLVEQAWALSPIAALADPSQGRALVEELCRKLAASEGLADFVRNSGTPEQKMFTE